MNTIKQFIYFGLELMLFIFVLCCLGISGIIIGALCNIAHNIN